MPAPSTLVVFIDEDADEFPIRLPGVYRENRAADFEAAMQLLRESDEMQPRGDVAVLEIQYLNDLNASA